jgi:hypothetical protein
MNKEEIEEFKKLDIESKSVLDYCRNNEEQIGIVIYENYDEELLYQLGRDLRNPESDKRDCIDILNKIEYEILPILKDKLRFRYEYIPVPALINIIYSLSRKIAFENTENIYIATEYGNDTSEIINSYIVVAKSVSKAFKSLQEENSNIRLTDIKLLIDNIEENKIGVFK